MSRFIKGAAPLKPFQDEGGKFKKGIAPNPEGSNGYTTVKRIEDALNDKAKQKGFKDFPAFVAKRAISNDIVLIAVLKKILPDKIQGEGLGSNTNIFTIIQRIQSEFISENSQPPLGMDRGDGLHAG